METSRNSESRGWHALPPAMVLALLLAVALGALEVARVVIYGHGLGGGPSSWSATMDSLNIATMAMLAFGAREIGLRSTGAIARGARIAAAGWLALIVLDLVWRWIVLGRAPSSIASSIERHQSALKVVEWLWFAGALLPPLGFAIGLWSTRRRLAIVGMAVAVVFGRSNLLGGAISSWLDLGYRGWIAWTNASYVICLVAILVMAAGCGAAVTPDPGVAANGLRRIAKALRLRVLGAVAMTIMTAAFIIGSRSGGTSLLELAMMAGLLINLTAFLIFAIGALAAARGAVADLSRWVLTIAAAMSLWCGGVLVGQVDPSRRDFRTDHTEITEALPLAQPLVALLACTLVAIAIGVFASRRGLNELRGEASSKGLAVVALLLASLGLQRWLLLDADSLGDALFAIAISALGGVAALVMMARLCDRGAAAVEGEQPLPTATVVSGRP